LVRMACAALRLGGAPIIAGVVFLPLALWGVGYAIGLRFSDLGESWDWMRGRRRPASGPPAQRRRAAAKAPPRARPDIRPDFEDDAPDEGPAAGPPWEEPAPTPLRAASSP